MTTPPPPRYHLFVGGDIAAQSVVVATQPLGGSLTTPFSIEQTPSGYASLKTRLL